MFVEFESKSKIEAINKWANEHSKEYSDFEVSCFFNSNFFRISFEEESEELFENDDKDIAAGKPAFYYKKVKLEYYYDCRIENRIMDIDSKKMIIVISPLNSSPSMF